MNYSPGINDEEFVRGKVPMTKKEIRLYLMALANIHPEATVIDIGAGTGAISIEAALIATQGKIYSIEREAQGIELIQANVKRFKTTNITIIHGTAPQAIYGLPYADVIFIGGSGGNLMEILETAYQHMTLQGKIICTAVTVETLQRVLIWADQVPVIVEACNLQVTRLKKAGKYHMFDALNPIYIISITKS